LKYKFFKIPYTKLLDKAFVMKPGELVISPDPDGHLPIEPHGWVVVTLLPGGFGVLNLGLFWHQDMAKTFAENLTIEEIQRRMS